MDTAAKPTPCDYEGCPNPAVGFWTVESVYCQEHLDQWATTAWDTWGNEALEHVEMEAAR